MNTSRLMTAYDTRRPEPSVGEERVAFGTSGHRGSAFDEAFYKLDAERFKDRDHLGRIQEEAHAIIPKAFRAGAAD